MVAAQDQNAGYHMIGSCTSPLRIIDRDLSKACLLIVQLQYPSTG